MAKSPRKPRPAPVAAPADDGMAEITRLSALAMRAWGAQAWETTLDAAGRSWSFSALPGQGLRIEAVNGRATVAMYVSQQALGAAELADHAVAATLAEIAARLAKAEA